MEQRFRRRCIVWLFGLTLVTAPAARGADDGEDPALSGVAWLAASAARMLPPCEVTVEAEGTDYETVLTFTLLDHIPDWPRPIHAIRRALASWGLPYPRFGNGST